MDIRIKRVYEQPADDDGYRVLVDRLWPRGVKKTYAQLDEWNKDVAPSTALRTWWNHDPERFEEFAAKYRHELETGEALPNFIEGLRQLGDEATVTLLYGAKNPEINHAKVLRDAVAELLTPTAE